MFYLRSVTELVYEASIRKWSCKCWFEPSQTCQNPLHWKTSAATKVSPVAAFRLHCPHNSEA